MFMGDQSETVTRLGFALLLTAAALAQATFFPALHLLSIGPDLTLVLILLWSAERGAFEGVVWAFPVGILLDILALDPLGYNALALLPAALVGGLARRRVVHSGVLQPMLLVVAATVAHWCVSAILGALLGAGYSLVFSLRLGLLTALLNVAIVPFLYLFVLMLERLGVVRAAQG